MNKKSFLLIVFTVVIVSCIFAFSGCGDVISAYDIAVKNGFIGTEQEWIESLYGLDGANGLNGNDGQDGSDGQIIVSDSYENLYAEAVKAGYDKDFLAFIKEYLSTSQTDQRYAINRALLSSVSIVNGGISAGSGVIYKMDKEQGIAYIITNYHVVYDDLANKPASAGIWAVGSDLKVYLYGSEYADYAMNAEYIGGSLTYDLAVIKVTSPIITNSDARAIEVTDDIDVYVGQTATAIGNAKGEGISVSNGIVSVDNETIEIQRSDDTSRGVSMRVMRIDAPVNKGNSGGGIFDIDGKLIGILNAGKISTDSDYVNSIAYAIPSNVVINICDNLIGNYSKNQYKVHRPIIGITTKATSVKAVYNEETQLTSIKETIMVNEVTRGSLGEASGLQVNDIIKKATFDDKTYEIDRNFKLSDLMLGAQVGETVVLEVLRGAETINISITVTNDCILLID